MKRYILVDDFSTKEYLNSLSLDSEYITNEDSIEGGSLLIIHIQSFKSIIDVILESYKNAKLAIISDNPSFDEGYSYLRFGIKAYANTYMAEIHYKQLIGMLENNNNWFYPEFTNRLLNCAVSHQPQPETKKLKRLSKKEREVATLVAQSLKNIQIAQALNIKERTVKQHLSNIYKKLEIHDRVSLAMMFS